MHACCITAFCLVLGAMSACRGSSSTPGASNDPPGTASGTVPDDAGEPGDDAAAPATPPAPAIEVFETGGVAEKIALRRLGALAPWDAVVNRSEYLGRRGEKGAIHGRLGPPAGDPGRGYHWLIDDTEGSGSLAVRVSYGPGNGPEGTLPGELTAGERVLVWGAWHVDDDLRWYWKAARVARLEARDIDIPEDARSQPGHHIATIAAPPAGALPVSQAIAEPRPRPTDIIFKVIRDTSPRFTGWEISDEAGWKPVARLHLPGERESYGAQDLRSPDEYWRLERDVRYVVRVKRVVPPGPGQLATLRAINAPRQITGAAR